MWRKINSEILNVLQNVTFEILEVCAVAEICCFIQEKGRDS